MKLKITIYQYFIIYFFLLMGLYHYKIKTYFYWLYVAELQGETFEISVIRVLVAVAFFLINLYFFSTIQRKKFSFIVIAIFFALLTIPSLIAFTSGKIYPYKIMLYHQSLFFGLFFFSKIRVNFEKVPVINKTQALYLLISITTIGVLPYLWVYGPHLNLKNLFLIDVYQSRRVMGELSNPYFGYTYSLFTKIIIPLIIVFSIEKKKKVWLVLGVFYLVLFYLFGAHKTVYVGLLIVLGFYKFSFEKIVAFIMKYANVFIVVCLIFAFVGFDYPWILTFRRIQFVPTLLDICYIDFFNDNPIYWSESIFKSFIEYPYDVKHTNLIGDIYFNRPEMAANNGLISDGYMNFQSWGVAIHIFLVSVYFMLLNSLKISSKYFGLFMLVIFSFISSSTFTVFLTHGALALLIVAIFFLNEKKMN